MQQTWAEAFRNCRAIGYSTQLCCILLALRLLMAAICMARKKGYMMTVMPECQKKKSRIERNKKALKKAADSGNPEYLLKILIMGAYFVKVPVWNVESEIGYKPITTFWQDFSIADAFGIDAVRDTFKRTFNEWKGNCKYLTELVMVLNHKIAQWYDSNKPMAQLYNDLWRFADNYACNNLKGDELAYFYRVTD